jgi:hypothetical protein
MVDMRENKIACHTATGAAAKNRAPGTGSIQDACKKCRAAALRAFGMRRDSNTKIMHVASESSDHATKLGGGTTLWEVWGRGVWAHARAPREFAVDHRQHALHDNALVVHSPAFRKGAADSKPAAVCQSPGPADLTTCLTSHHCQ